MSKHDYYISIFIGTESNPEGGRWYDLSSEWDRDDIENKVLSNTDTQWIVSDKKSLFKLKDEQDVGYYIEYQEMVESLTEGDLEKIGVVLENDRNYFQDARAAENFAEVARIRKGDIIEYVKKRIEDGYLGDNVRELYVSNSSYIDVNAIAEWIRKSRSIAEVEWRGEMWILETE